MIYVDTSLIVSAITREASTAAAQLWLREAAAGQLCASWWHQTEVASALARKQRAGELDAAQQSGALAQWFAMMTDWVTLPIERAHFSLAADLTSRGVRSADALHLAVAMAARSALATRDKVLAEVAGQLALTVHRLP